jgi:hypothetical protein
MFYKLVQRAKKIAVDNIDLHALRIINKIEDKIMQGKTITKVDKQNINNYLN